MCHFVELLIQVLPAALVCWILAEVVTRAAREPVYYTLGKEAVCYQRFGASTHQLTEQVHTRMHAHTRTHTHTGIHAAHACLHTQYTHAHTHTQHTHTETQIYKHNTHTNNNNHIEGKAAVCHQTLWQGKC